MKTDQVETRRFQDIRSATYERAVAALADLYEETGSIDLTQRAAAEVLAAPQKARYAKQYGLKQSAGRNILPRLIDKQPPLYFLRGCRWVDHPTLWIKNGKPHSFVGQPYGLQLQHLKQIVAFCQEHGLDAQIEADYSWHFPGRTLFVELSRKASDSETPYFPTDKTDKSPTSDLLSVLSVPYLSVSRKEVTKNG